MDVHILNKYLFLDNKNFSAKEIAENIIEDVQKYSTRGKYTDDKTVVIIKRIK